MEINWIIVGIAVALGVALVVFLFKKNNKDEKDFETFSNNNDLPLEEDDEELNNNK